MRRLLGPTIAALCLAGSLLAPAARAQNQGQADLDKAMQLKMTASSLTEMGEVIRLTESAMEKGLDKGNRAFAQSLLVSTLIQRGTDTAAAIFHGNALDSNWVEDRKAALADLERGVALDAKQPQTMLLIAKLNIELPGGDAKRTGQALDEVVKLSANEPMLAAEALVLRSGLRKDLKDKAADLDEAARLAPRRAAIFRARRGPRRPRQARRRAGGPRPRPGVGAQARAHLAGQGAGAGEDEEIRRGPGGARQGAGPVP